MKTFLPLVLTATFLSVALPALADNSNVPYFQQQKQQQMEWEQQYKMVRDDLLHKREVIHHEKIRLHEQEIQLDREEHRQMPHEDLLHKREAIRDEKIKLHEQEIQLDKAEMKLREAEIMHRREQQHEHRLEHENAMPPQQHNNPLPTPPLTTGQPPAAQ